MTPLRPVPADVEIHLALRAIATARVRRPVDVAVGQERRPGDFGPRPASQLVVKQLPDSAVGQPLGRGGCDAQKEHRALEPRPRVAAETQIAVRARTAFRWTFECADRWPQAPMKMTSPRGPVRATSSPSSSSTARSASSSGSRPSNTSTAGRYSGWRLSDNFQKACSSSPYR